MTIDAFRLKNFMAFRDTGWIDLRAITLLFGRNSSGKSAIIRGLRLLKQSLYTQQRSPILRFVVEGQLDLGDFQTALHKRRDFENYSDAVEGQKITFQFRGSFLENTIESIHGYVNRWLEQNGYSQLGSVGSNPELTSIEFSLEYGYTYDQQTKAQIIQLVGVHIDCPWEALSKLKKTNFLSVHRLPPLTHEKGRELALPDPMVWSQDCYWESDFDLGQIAQAESVNWRDISVEAVKDFLPGMKLPTDSPYTSQQERNSLLYDTLNEIFMVFGKNLENFLDIIEYLGPIRPDPERTYMLKREEIDHWQQQGWRAWLNTLREGEFAPPPLVVETNIDISAKTSLTSWMQELELGEQLYVRRFRDIPESDLAAQIFILNKSKHWDNLRDVGYGASQVLPIIAACLRAQPGSLVIVEQPELHLHPKAQLQLAHLFFHAIERNVKLLLETHSEHFTLRLRSQIVANTLDALKNSKIADNPSVWATEQLIIGFVSKDSTGSTVTCMTVNDTGDFINEPKEFKEFFVDDAIEIMKITRNALQVDLLQGR